MDKISVIYKDASLLVLDKPAGLVVDRSESQKSETVEDILKKVLGISLERGGIVHRLDKDTSGLLLVAKTQNVLENLQAQFKTRQVKKEYLVLVHGLIEEGRIVTGAIERNPVNREKFTVLENGKQALTRFEPLKKFLVSPAQLSALFPDFNNIQMRKLQKMRYGEFTLLRGFPETGRTHQIRVHLKYIGHPVVSDEKYGGRKIVRLDKRWCPRQFLHATKIEFAHPVSGSRMVIESSLAGDLNNALQLLESGHYYYG